MIQQLEPDLAHKLEYVRFLAIFQRTFTAIIEYTNNGDKEGILLGGHLADALHNVPEMLLQNKSHSTYTTEDITEWMRKFPKQIERYGASPQIVTDVKRIVSLDYNPSELELSSDLTDFYLAPLPRLHLYLSFIYHNCVEMRVIQTFGSKPINRAYHPFENLDQVWTEEADSFAEINGKLATILLPIPKGLVQWSRFDEEQIRRTGITKFGESWKTYWSKFISSHESRRNDGDRTDR